VDTLHLVLEEFGDRELYARVEGALGRTMTLNEVIAAEFATVTEPLEEVVAWLLENARIRTGFAELARERRPLIVSSGFHETIEPLLAREGVAVDVVANRLDPRPDGWRVLWADDAPCPECGDLCKRRALPAGRPLVYVGDGWSDQCAARAADRVFARRALAEYFDQHGLPYERFETFDDVAAALS
jgi:2-hydroxy-3-keto-5-methylthiopentenyl-1-phosphate phosphatase